VIFAGSFVKILVRVALPNCAKRKILISALGFLKLKTFVVKLCENTHCKLRFIRVQKITLMMHWRCLRVEALDRLGVASIFSL